MVVHSGARNAIVSTTHQILLNHRQICTQRQQMEVEFYVRDFHSRVHLQELVASCQYRLLQRGKHWRSTTATWPVIQTHLYRRSRYAYGDSLSTKRQVNELPLLPLPGSCPSENLAS